MGNPKFSNCLEKKNKISSKKYHPSQPESDQVLFPILICEVGQFKGYALTDPKDASSPRGALLLLLAPQ